MSSFLSFFIGISFVLRWDCFPRDNTARKERDDDDRARKERWCFTSLFFLTIERAIMFGVDVFLLASIGLIGILFNWLLILAIQRKTYHYQEAHRSPTPVTNMSLLRPHISPNAQTIRPPLLPSIRSSISPFDKYILAMLINDILSCNFLLPLRLIDLSQGLPCIFLCFLVNVLEKLITVSEIVILTLLIITSLLFFAKKRLVTTKLSLFCLFVMSPLIVMYLTTTLVYFDIYESESNRRAPSCKQTYSYITLSTFRTLNILCCLITYGLVLLHFILLMKMKWAIKKYTLNSLKSITEAATLTRNNQQEILLFDQVSCIRLEQEINSH